LTHIGDLNASRDAGQGVFVRVVAIAPPLQSLSRSIQPSCMVWYGDHADHLPMSSAVPLSLLALGTEIDVH
jgi:hypothetical protein